MSIKLIITYRSLESGVCVASIDDLQLFSNGSTREEAKENLLKNLDFHVENFGIEFVTRIKNNEYEIFDFSKV